MKTKEEIEQRVEELTRLIHQASRQISEDESEDRPFIYEEGHVSAFTTGVLLNHFIKERDTLRWVLTN